MSTFYLIRHGSNDWLGRGIAGRQKGVSLNAQGHAEARRAADVLTSRKITRIVSSPLDRALETAHPLASALKLQVEIETDVQELDFGEWSGVNLKDLDKQEHWKRFNHFRTGTRPPNGETMIEVQARFVAAMDRLRQQSPEAEIAIFSHADPIRTALCYYLGMPLDNFNRLEVTPGSISTVKVTEWQPEIQAINWRP